MITLIAAVARNGVIGSNNSIPWHLPEDFKHFSATTKGHVVIMGSRTWESLPERFRPLPKRFNIVVSSGSLGEMVEVGVSGCKTIADAITLAGTVIDDARSETNPLGGEIFVIGGASVYEQTIIMADRLIISEVDMEPDGDTFFPEIGPEWVVQSRDNRQGFSIIDYRRG